MPINKAFLGSPEYPGDLAQIHNPPPQLYYRGTMPHGGLALAVVGSRKMTDYGKAALELIISGFAGHDITIISGLAYGVDAYAHRCAIKCGLKTAAVLGGGIDSDSIYPKEHTALAEEIIASGGAIISEFEPGSRAFPSNFPRRNRIIAGMSRAAIIIEADFKSGARITGRIALEENRDVFAVPGSIFEQQSRGANALIRDGAYLIASAEDILNHYGLEPRKKYARQASNLSPIEENIIKNLAARGISFEGLIAKSSLSPAQLNTALINLEMSGLVRRLPNNFFALNLTQDHNPV